ncbi:restriction endonuclease subunit S [Pseudomonas paraeruginosa]|uniref:restriction endonuclease subunit S n=1 Tax=Pseudomonas paraeruginosa TaxID=2994495 RepID=UPI0039FDC8CE|nr:restriction endonuclease subunit S [Pseudomonas aeruginosa]HCF2410319.1 restriction endonuclease subunit S [Pseudomonas aeruginosa]
MSHYKPYPAYKDSGVDWLGPVPDHWQVVRMRYAATLNPPVRSDLLGDPDQEVSFLPMEAIGEDGSLSLEQVRPVADVRNGYSYFEDGDVAFAKVTPCFENGKGALMRGLQCAAGFGTTELTVLRPKPAAADARYINYIVQGSSFRAFGAGAMTGAGGLKRVPDEFTRNFPVPLPELGEQRLIAAHLDSETTRIDTLIEKKTRFIELLREKRQALITHAVTKGLDPSVKMKDSGVEWLREVPEHWGVSPLKHLVRFRSGGTPSKDNLEFWNGDIPWASAKDLKQEVLADTIDHLNQSAIESGAASLVPSGSILVVVRGMILARLFPVVETLVPMAINQDLKALVPSGKLNSRYLAHLLRGSSAESLSRLEEAGHGTKALRMENWVSIELPVPPLHEQLAIIEMLDIQTARLDSLADKTERSIALLTERRSALITAAVTGQIDLREAV